MFKRVEKRRKKQEKEEELGLTEEMKEVLGMHDTDSEESDSSDGDESEGDTVDEVPSDDESSDGSLHEEPEVDRGEDEDEDESDVDLPLISVVDAMKDPIYFVSPQSDIQACAVCPGKLLKNAPMAESHKQSKAHDRRFARFVEFAGGADPDTDMREFWTLLKTPAVRKPKEVESRDALPLSNRAQKRIAKMEAIKAKRKKGKELKAKAIKKRQAAKATKLEDSATEPANAPTQAAEPDQRPKSPSSSKKRKAPPEADAKDSPSSPIRAAISGPAKPLKKQKTQAKEDSSLEKPIKSHSSQQKSATSSSKSTGTSTLAAQTSSQLRAKMKAAKAKAISTHPSKALPKKVAS